MEQNMDFSQGVLEECYVVHNNKAVVVMAEAFFLWKTFSFSNLFPIFANMKCYLKTIILALLTVPVASRAQYNMYIQKADSLFYRGEYAQSSTMFEKAFQTGQNIDGKDLYNAACVAALTGKSDVAFRYLWARMEKEPDWYSRGGDEDLVSLHGDPRWQTFTDSMTTRRNRVEGRYSDQILRQQLQRIGEADQNIRREWFLANKAKPRDKAKIDSILHQMQLIDSQNQAEICDILDKRGFVGSDAIGEVCEVFWTIIQHAPVETERKYLPLFQRAAARGDIAQWQVATMEDRIAMFEGRPQKYGTQLDVAADGTQAVYKLLNPKKVDEWRREKGMGSLTEYLKSMGAKMPKQAKEKRVKNHDLLRRLIAQGDSCIQSYNTFDALGFYQEAYEKEATIEVQVKLADCYYKRGNYRKTSDLLKLVPEDSLSHDAFRQLAFSYQKQGDTDSYIYWASQLIGRYPTDGEVVAGLTAAFSQKEQPQKALQYGLDYCSQYDDTNMMVNRAVADAFFLERDFKAAALWYKKLLEQGDSTFNTLYSAGMCYAQLQDLETAYEHLKSALFLSQMQHYGAAYRLGVVCIDTKRYEEGLRYLNIAKELMKPDPAVMKAITLSEGEGYYLTQHYQEAVTAWKEHLTWNPTSITTYYNLANAYAYLLKDSEQAKVYYQQFLDLAQKEETPSLQLLEMMKTAEEMLK